MNINLLFERDEMANNKKNILVTGATGYIGTNLCKALANKYNIHALSRSPNCTLEIEHVFNHTVESPEIDLPLIFEKNSFFAVIHLAAKARHDWNESSIPNFIEANITLGSILLEVMTKNGCNNFISTSSYWQEFSDIQKVPNCFYAATKTAFTKIIDFYVHERSLNAISLRLFDVYGPNDIKRPKIFSLIKKAASENKKFEASPGQQEIYFTHITDVIEAYEMTLDHFNISKKPSHQQYDVRGFKYNLKDAIEVFCQVNEIDVEISWGAQPYRKNQIFQPVIFQELPNWNAKIDITTGFRGI